MKDFVDDIKSMTAEKLKKIFSLDDHKEYFGFIPLVDRQAGFTIKRKYPPNIKYRPPVTKANEPDVVSIIRVVYVSPLENRKKIDSHKVPIYLLISPFSKYLSKYMDYNFDDKECPTEESIRNSERTQVPIQLQSFDEYMYDHKTDTLQTIKGKRLTGKQLLDSIFNEHISTIHPFKGLNFRLKIGFKKVLVNVCTFVLTVLEKIILKKCFGRTLKSSETIRGTINPYKKEDLQLLKMEYLNLFGYKASKNIIILFSIAVIIFSFLVYNHNVEFYNDFLSNNLTSVCTGVLLLLIFDRLIPYLILLIINIVIMSRSRLLMMRIRT